MASRNLEKLRAQADFFRQAGFEIEVLQYDQSSEESIQQLLKQVARSGGQGRYSGEQLGAADHEGLGRSGAELRQEHGSQRHGHVRDDPRSSATTWPRRAGAASSTSARSRGSSAPISRSTKGSNWGAPPDYFFHKGGLLQLTRYAAAVLGPRGVRVNAISPGGFFNNQDESFVKRYNARTFLGRMANETDIKGGIVYPGLRRLGVRHRREPRRRRRLHVQIERR